MVGESPMTEHQIKLINDRIRTLKDIIRINGKIVPSNEREGGWIDAESDMALDEIAFLENLLKFNGFVEGIVI